MIADSEAAEKVLARASGTQLKPVIMIGDAGLSESVSAEFDSPHRAPRADQGPCPRRPLIAWLMRDAIISELCNADSR